MTGHTYILQFSSPQPNHSYGNPWHYVGYAKNPERRIREHFRGRGGQTTSRALRSGADLKVMSVEPGTLKDEAFITKTLKSFDAPAHKPRSVWRPKKPTMRYARK